MNRRSFLNKAAVTSTSLVIAGTAIGQKQENKPLQVAVIGLVHTHVHGILGSAKDGVISIIAIVEPNKILAEKYSRQYGFNLDIVFSTMEDMIEKVTPEAVSTFTTTFDHLKVVEFFAPRGIHIMVEKPLAVNMIHAEKMTRLAKKHNIRLLTNYETTWYATHKRAHQVIKEEKMAGEMRKIVFHTGHQGPFEIGCNVEFTDWLTDPILNGGGALTDFGCYGANLATWLMNGQRPLTVTCITQNIKPDRYPKVEDEATILLTYPKSQVIIQASWNWPFNRKDMEIYGEHGQMICEDRNNLIFRWKNMKKVEREILQENMAPFNDPFAYLAAVVRNKITPEPFDLSSPENNLIVMEILDAARASTNNGVTIKL